jgi:hypothetical protein
MTKEGYQVHSYNTMWGKLGVIKSGWGKAAECAAVQTLRETQGARNLAPAFGVRGIPALSVVCERVDAHRPHLFTAEETSDLKLQTSGKPQGSNFI